MIGRVSTFSAADYLMSLNMQTQARMNDAQTQESSGLKSQTYSGIAQDVGKLLNIDGQIDRLNTDDANATSDLSTMQAAYSAMSDVTDLGTTILAALSSYMSNGASDAATIQSTAQGWLTQLSSVLNGQYDGGYLFAGQAANTPPVDLGAAGYDPTANPSSPDTGYYQGSANGLTYAGSDGYRATVSVQADDPGFEKMFRALSLVVASPGSSATLAQAYDLVQSGITDVGASQAVLGTASAALTTYQTRAQDKATALGTLAISLKNCDLSTATVLVTSYQTQLESSYATVTKLLSETLSKYL